MNQHDFFVGQPLSEVAMWTRPGAAVQLPPLQRGLVWKPRQVELLWDSILRGFPIGSFVLSEEPNDKYYLMDGQQRFNAIALGFNTVGSSDPDSVIWLDIEPGQTVQSTRKYWVKITTLAHPWGYKNDDDCNVLSAAEREAALEKFGIGDVYKQKPDLRKTYPYMAKMPVPLHYLLSASTESADSFARDAQNRLKANEDGYAYVTSIGNIVETPEFYRTLTELYHAFAALRDYRIGFSLLPRDVIEKEEVAQEDNGGPTPLEVLFTRLNTGGTRISQDDLLYSAIKAYWPNIKEKNDEIAARYMSPSKLAMSVFRLVLSVNDPEYKNGSRMCGDLSIRKIRELSRNGRISEAVDRFYNKPSECESADAVTDRIERWFGIGEPDGMPRVIRTSIAVNSPDVYLLLMWLAYERVELPAEFVRGLALYLHWFANDARKCVNMIFGRCSLDGISATCIRSAIADSVLNEYSMGLYSSEELRELFIIKREKDWRVWSENSHTWANFFNRIAWLSNRHTKEMLLYAQRRYINGLFLSYDPARQDLWADQNRPWDFDHIIPQDWIVGIRGDYREYCKHWLNNIGNIAAIPFSVNRSKSNTADFEYYIENADELLYMQTNGVTPDLARDSSGKQAFEFAKNTFDRCCRIYEECYSTLKYVVAEPVPSGSETATRRELCMEIQKRLENLGCRCYFVAEDREYELVREADWTRPWVSVGIPVESGCMVSFTSFRPDANGETVHEIGVRRYPGTTSLKQDIRLSDTDPDLAEYSSNVYKWWYLYKNIDGRPNVDSICTEMEKLLNKISKNS